MKIVTSRAAAAAGLSLDEAMALARPDALIVGINLIDDPIGPEELAGSGSSIPAKSQARPSAHEITPALRAVAIGENGVSSSVITTDQRSAEVIRTANELPRGRPYRDPIDEPEFVTSVDDQGRSLGEVEQLAAFCGCSLEFWQNKYELRGTFGVGRYATLPEVVAALKAQRFTPAAGIALPPTSPEFEQHRRAAVSPEHMPKAEPPAHLRTGSQVQANMLPGETGAQYLQRTRQHVPEVVVLSITGTEYRNTRLD